MRKKKNQIEGERWLPLYRMAESDLGMALLALVQEDSLRRHRVVPTGDASVRNAERIAEAPFLANGQLVLQAGPVLLAQEVVSCSSCSFSFGRHLLQQLVDKMRGIKVVGVVHVDVYRRSRAAQVVLRLERNLSKIFGKKAQSEVIEFVVAITAAGQLLVRSALVRGHFLLYLFDLEQDRQRQLVYNAKFHLASLVLSTFPFLEREEREEIRDASSSFH